jgi:hypothetical protein
MLSGKEQGKRHRKQSTPSESEDDFQSDSGSEAVESDEEGDPPSDMAVEYKLPIWRLQVQP